MIEKLAKWYERSPIARFVVVVPVIGDAIHEYLIAKAKEADLPTPPFRNLWGFDKDTIYMVCSQLEESEGRQEPEQGEFLYLGKYGDIDALLEVLTSLGRLFPRLNVKFCTDEEFNRLPGNPYANNLILIGGPDYNKITRHFMQYTPFEFIDKNGITVLKHKETGQIYESKFIKKEGIDEVIDYGFFLKIPNPNNTSKKVIMINGIHTYSVYGAAKCFLSHDENERDITVDNCNKIVKKIGKNPNFSILLEVKCINKKVGIPKVDETNLISL